MRARPIGRLAGLFQASDSGRKISSPSSSARCRNSNRTRPWGEPAAASSGYRYTPPFCQHHIVRLALSILLAVSLLPLTAHGETRAPDRVTLLVKTDRPIEEGSFGLTVRGAAHGWQRVSVPVAGTIEKTIGELRDRLGAPVAIDRRYALAGPEAEPLFDQQWGLENTGQAGGTPDADVDARAAWSVATGAGAVVAVVDSGVDPTHPELDTRIWTNPGEVADDGIDNDANGYRDDARGWDFVGMDKNPAPDGVSDEDAHATFIAGVLAAEVDGAGMTGIALAARIMNLRACDNGFCFSFDASRAIFYAVDMGADVINLSFGSPVPRDLGDPIMEDAMDYALAKGVLVVTAAGNIPPGEVASDEMMIPAEFPHANNIAVAASNRRDQLAEFSYYSPAIDIAAPGVAIVASGLDGYYSVDGTSFAAPFVSGTAALLLSKDAKMGYAELAERIKGFADRPSGIGTRVEAGRLNAGRALTRPFLDTLGHLFEKDIEWAADQGVTKGCNPPLNTRFCPNDPVTREVMAAFLTRYLDLGPASRDYFTDDESSIFEDDINRLAEAGITRGCGGTRFCPRTVVDRGQMAAFLVRAFRLTDDGGGDLFTDDDTSIFERDIDILGTAGITKGCNPPQNTMYCPDRAVDRGAMAAFLHRAPAP